jgi:hypothetical protein
MQSRNSRSHRAELEQPAPCDFILAGPDEITGRSQRHPKAAEDREQ